MEDNKHIEVIEEENPQISFAAALKMLNQLQDFASPSADTEIQCRLAFITEKLQDVTNAGNKLRLKTFYLQNFQCS